LRQKAGLRLDTAANLVKGGDSGPAVEPGNAKDSYLLQMLTGESGSRMPPEDDGAALAAEEIALITKWIDEGARAPEETPPPDPREHWAYKLPVRPDVPSVQNAAWVMNPIDAFIAAGQQSLGVTPVGEADKATLLRRVYLDIIGLPPTREQLAAYLNNDSPGAYEKVVDELLASPQYGERWARHWMDVWRYSDWAGYREEIRDSARHIWRWRDWIVESLNADKGYDRMLTEMLAGDEVAPTDPNTLRATGFLVRNWHKFNRNTWLEGTIEHTAKAFLGVTMNCCRCHDHKFDPISQVEYYRMRAIFEPHDVRTDRVPGEADILKDGLPYACDLNPDVATYVFERGNEKRPLKDEAITPGVPEALGRQLSIKPVERPLSAYYPALQEFAIHEDVARTAGKVKQFETELTKAQAVVAAVQNLTQPSPTAQRAGASSPPVSSTLPSIDDAVAAAELLTKQLATARAAHTSLEARIAAEKAKYGLIAGATDEQKKQLAEAAAKAQRELGLCQAQEQQLVATRELAAAKAALKPGDAATANAAAAAEQKVSAAATALTAAHAALAQSTLEYQPLGEVQPKTSTGRRSAFAHWLTDRKNPLVARVAINHIWLRHFGAPLVDNMFDFGLRSPECRNQPLLDWIAVELMDRGWQMKHIHRLLVTSNTYRMSSGAAGASAANFTLDRDNRFLWRMNTRRLEAELVRDALFQTAGTLDLTMGGPDIACELASKTPRRSIYLRHAYEKHAKFLELFDAASVNECYRRSESVVPQQALALANSDLSVDQSRILAKNLSAAAATTPAPDLAFIQLAFEQILNRQPSSVEAEECRTFLASQTELLRDPSKLTPTTGGAKASIPASTDPIQRARENLTLVLFNHNDFVTIR
jgi:hypothetical protein